MRLPLSDVVDGIRLLWRLPRFLRHRVTAEEARSHFRERLAGRDTLFLTFVRRAIYEHRRSPYRVLLAHAGCAYGDLVRLVEQDGIEGALAGLAEQGVYLTVDEYKRRRPVVRGSLRLEFRHADLFNPLTRSAFTAWTSGSRRAVEVPTDLAFVRTRAVEERLLFEVGGAQPIAEAIWLAPGSGVIVRLLSCHARGVSRVAWFSQLDPAMARLHPRYRWSVRLLRWVGRPLGMVVPRPVYAPPNGPAPVLEWVVAARRMGLVWVLGPTSSLVALGRAAQARGISLSGVCFMGGAEPLTPARRAAIEASGARVRLTYGGMDSGRIGVGCENPASPDDTHLLHTSHAAIPAPLGAGLPRGAILLSSLLTTAPVVLFNTSLGDSATIERRSCGCPFDGLGLPIHLSNIRSYEKVTSSGWKALDVDLIRILEQVLPARCGGGPGDYQLVEEGGEDGFPRLRLLVSPAAGAIGLETVRTAFLDAVGSVAPAQQMTAAVWDSTGLLAVERREPYVGASGKILHLHVADSARSLTSVRP